MTDKDITSQLEGLFSDTAFDSDAEVERVELDLEEAVVSLLGGAAEAESVADRSAFRQDSRAEGGEAPPALAEAVGLHRGLVIGERGARILGFLLRGVTVLGGALLLFLILRLIWGKPMNGSGFHILYFAAYAMTLFIALMQWVLNSSLNKALREAEDRRTEPVPRFQEQAYELVRANALLQKRALQLQAAAQLSQIATSASAPDELIQQAVDLIRQRLDLYYVGVFLVDESGQWAVLQAGAGEAGHQMLEQGYRLGIDGASTVGRCIAGAQARIAPNLDATRLTNSAEDPGTRSEQLNPLLPAVRSEIALPLCSQGQVIGALDMQSTVYGAFLDEDVPVLQEVADQIAIGLGQARLFAEMRAKLEEMEARQRQDVREQWDGFMSRRATPVYERARPGAVPLSEALLSGSSSEIGHVVEQAMERGEAVVQSGADDGAGRATLAVPVSLRGEVLGVLGLHEAEGGRWWTEEEIALVEAVADQMALAIENARLLEETRRRGERERLVADISAKVRASTDVDTILYTAIRELGRALRASDGLIRLDVGGEPGSSQPDEEGREQ